MLGASSNPLLIPPLEYTQVTGPLHSLTTLSPRRHQQPDRAHHPRRHAQHLVRTEEGRSPNGSSTATTEFQHTTAYLSSVARPLLVELFQNAPLAHILHMLSLVPLDLVQLHSSEPAGLPASPSSSPSPSSRRTSAHHGEALERRATPIVLAGGPNATTVREAVRRIWPWAVDVASGVEVEGRKDEGTMRAFVGAAKHVGEELLVPVPVPSEPEEEMNGAVAPAGPAEAKAQDGIDVGTEVFGHPTELATSAPPVPSPGGSGTATTAYEYTRDEYAVRAYAGASLHPPS